MRQHGANAEGTRLEAGIAQQRIEPDEMAAGLVQPLHLFAQALADVATIGLLQERSLRRSETMAEQLQAALNSRVIIEQAKGKLAERLSTDMDEAFRLLRDHARQTNQRLTDVARNFVDSASADFPPAPRR